MRMQFNARNIPLTVTVMLFSLMYGAGTLAYDFSLQVFLNLFIDNAFLIIVAVGMSFVILSGGIDLSVGSVIALTTITSAVLLEHYHWPIWAVIPTVLLGGALFGAWTGFVIHHFRLQAFIVTLAGMFLARGLCYLISIDTVTINNASYVAIAQQHLPVWGDAFVSWNVVIALGVLAIAIFLAHYTGFGRNVYAIGGNERSAVLMGLPVARTKVMVYALSGFCSSLAGVVFTFYMLSGYGLHAQGMELDAIAAAVIGGILLTGGSGYIVGTLFGVLILGLIQTLIMFDGSLSAWWTRIAIGALLCVFCVLQRTVEHHTGPGRKRPPPASKLATERSVAADAAKRRPILAAGQAS